MIAKATTTRGQVISNLQPCSICVTFSRIAVARPRTTSQRRIGQESVTKCFQGKDRRIIEKGKIQYDLVGDEIRDRVSAPARVLVGFPATFSRGVEIE